jgi:murein DD-endopeptidase MepM/ murein hydrolase activator NlpD
MRLVLMVLLIAAVTAPTANAGNVTDVLAKYKSSVGVIDSVRLQEKYVASIDNYLTLFSDWAQGRTLEHAQNIGRHDTELELRRVAFLIDEAAYTLKNLRDEQFELVQSDAPLRQILECEDSIRHVTGNLLTLSNTYIKLLSSYDSLSIYDSFIVRYASEEDVEIARILMETSKLAFAEAMQFEDIGEVRNLKSPIANGRFHISSRFGYRNDPLGEGVRFHYGLDLAANTGDGIRSLFNGVVVIAKESNTGYGNYVVIDHGNGLRTLYAHASKNLVQVGQRVKQYDLIQLAGSTGRSTGPHLHLGVFVDNVLVDPIKLFYD